MCWCVCLCASTYVNLCQIQIEVVLCSAILFCCISPLTYHMSLTHSRVATTCPYETFNVYNYLHFHTCLFFIFFYMAVVWLTLICKDSSFASEKMLKEARAQWVHVFQLDASATFRPQASSWIQCQSTFRYFHKAFTNPAQFLGWGIHVVTCGYHEQLSINNDRRIQEINRSLLSDILQPLDISIVTMFYTSYQNIWDHCLPRGSTTKNLHRPRRCSFSSRIYQW